MKYYECTRGDSVENQTYIHETLKNEIISNIPKLEPKDKIRNFTEDQRWLIFQSAKKNKNGNMIYECQADTTSDWYSPNHCENKITLDNFHADHIIPHSGNPPGKTSLENGQALCVPCNLRKSNK